METVSEEATTLERSELFAQLQNAACLRSAQDQVLWTIFGVFWAANAILLVALFTTGGWPTEASVIATIAAVGAALSLVWHWIQARALGHVQRFERLMARLEKQLDVSIEYRVSSTPEDDYEELLSRGFRARTVMPICSAAAAVAWIAGLMAAGAVSLLSGH